MILRPAFRYYGGKFKLANWIVGFFPKHSSYLEPCGGAASVLMVKKPVRLETYNDIDGAILNFFRVLRKQESALIRAIKLTPYHRDEYKNSLIINNDDDDLERARKFFITCQMSFSGIGSGFRTSVTKSDNVPAIYFTAEHLHKVAERLINVQFENMDAIKCIERYDAKDCLIYFDPPYIESTRVKKKQYTYEVDEKFHIECAALLNKAESHVVVSGYKSELYRELYENNGFIRIDIKSQLNSRRFATESIWLSPSAVKNTANPVLELN